MTSQAQEQKDNYVHKFGVLHVSLDGGTVFPHQRLRASIHQFVTPTSSQSGSQLITTLQPHHHTPAPLFLSGKSAHTTWHLCPLSESS